MGMGYVYDQDLEFQCEHCNSRMHMTCDCPDMPLALRNLMVTIPYNLTAYDLKIDPGSVGRTLKEELMWLDDHAKHDEIRRIVTSTALLLEVGAGTEGECLHTAIIWERG